MREILRELLPEWIKRPIRYVRRKITELLEYRIIYAQPSRHRKALERVQGKDKITVAFFATHSAVWKYDGVYQLMEKDPRFEPVIVVCPVMNYGHENMLAEMKKTYDLFQNKGYKTIKTYNEEEESYLDVKKEIAPNIIFYTNPHHGLVKDEYYITNYQEILSCYTQYSFHVTHLNEAQYNQLFHNILWKAFYETNIHKKIAEENSRNKGSNVIVTGYPGIDDFIFKGRIDNNVWQNPDVSLKRIIWSPHHTIDNREKLNFSTFLRYHQLMLDIVENYKDKIQVAFKPHPLLKIKLIRHEDWGQKRTQDYYRKWERIENGQLETDDYVDLFNSSDAMILDSASFVVEYLCCGKPSLFTFSDSNVRDRFNKFGKLALEQHYHAYCEKQIIDFIKNVVFDGKDNKQKNRELFYNAYLIPPHNSTASQNIFNEIVNEVFI